MQGIMTNVGSVEKKKEAFEKNSVLRGKRK